MMLGHGCFNLYMGNRMEVLAGQLADALWEPLGDPLKNEVVIDKNRSMERWVSPLSPGQGRGL
jgi:hypothetical protein